jgi:hypothetical protein
MLSTPGRPGLVQFFANSSPTCWSGRQCQDSPRCLQRASGCSERATSRNSPTLTDASPKTKMGTMNPEPKPNTLDFTIRHRTSPISCQTASSQYLLHCRELREKTTIVEQHSIVFAGRNDHNNVQQDLQMKPLFQIYLGVLSILIV